jgi:hypothetical protein
MTSKMQSSGTGRPARVLRRVRPLLWLFVFSLTSLSGAHWPTWECNLPPRVSGVFACYTTLDV